MDKLSISIKMKTKKALIAALLALILAATAQAERIGVVVTFPDGTTHKECIETEDNASAYEIMQQTSLPLGWSYDSTWGHGMCSINSIGCPEDNCYCSSDYWGFYIGTGSWHYSPVGFDAGDCWNRDWNSWDGHYCARDGDLI